MLRKLILNNIEKLLNWFKLKLLDIILKKLKLLLHPIRHHCGYSKIHKYGFYIIKIFVKL